MQTLNGHTYLSTAELMIRTGKSRSSLVRWANKGCPGAYWSNYSHQWEWDIAEFEAGLRQHKTNPNKKPHMGANGNGRRGRLGQVR